MKTAKKRLNEDQVRKTLVEVARLYYEESLSQQQIADRLSVSRSLIAQYIQRARDLGIVRIQIVDQDNACTDLANTLKEETGLEQIIVIPNPHVPQELTLRAVCTAAADFLSSQFKDGDRFGLAWGRTNNVIVDLFKSTYVHGLDIIPLMGESSHEGMHSQMNQMIVHAAEHLQGTPHFLSVPMVVSSPELRSALVKEIGISDVVNLWDKINFACLGVGVVPPVPGMVVYVGEEHLPRLIKAGAVGDMCGIYFDRNGRIVENGLEDRIIAANFDQLKAIDCLTLVACGSEKATAVLGAMRTGLVSTLFIDQLLAETILAEFTAANNRKT